MDLQTHLCVETKLLSIVAMYFSRPVWWTVTLLKKKEFDVLVIVFNSLGFTAIRIVISSTPYYC